MNEAFNGPSNKDQLLITKITVWTVVTILLTGFIYFVVKDNLLFGFATLVLPLPIFYLYLILKNPRISLISVFFFNYFAMGLSRYIPGPLGLSVDIMLFLTFLIVIFSQFNQKIEWNLAANDYTFIAIIWFIMTVLQILNPEAVNKEAWFYAMRGYAVYIVLTVPLVYLIFNRPKDFELFISLCVWFTLIAALVALKQKFIGLDHWEKGWLMVPGNYSTHLLFGQLRIFSVYSDAGTFGGSMGYFGAIFIIFGIHEQKKSMKTFYFFVGLLALYSMLISGTRSAISVPLVTFLTYSVLTKKFKILIIAGGLAFVIFFFFKFTTIGQGNYDIRRMRSAFAENNASMNVRTHNRKLFADYLATRPFGGGIGSAGAWGRRFSPGNFLARTATDGWYIQIWAEEGIVGLSAYLLMMFYFVIKSSYLVFFKIKNDKYRYKAIAFTCGVFGQMASSYTAAALGQLPNQVIIFASLVFISMIPKWEKEEEENQKLYKKITAI